MRTIPQSNIHKAIQERLAEIYWEHPYYTDAECKEIFDNDPVVMALAKLLPGRKRA
jgi:hypothetical protein